MANREKHTFEHVVHRRNGEQSCDPDGSTVLHAPQSGSSRERDPVAGHPGNPSQSWRNVGDGQCRGVERQELEQVR